MASIRKDGVYINMLTIDREEAALLITAVLNALSCDDESLEETGQNIGGITNVRAKYEELGRRLDEDFDEMLKMFLSMMKE